jgi:3-deoxy-7-phosphoheptulonate synthase
MSIEQYPTDNLRIRGIVEVTPPAGIAQELPLTETVARTVFDTRRQIKDILHGRDDRLLVVVGPCSIHDPKAALEYAGRLKAQRERLADRLLIVMRVYFEKPRTTVGWKGLINDPDLDDSYHINKGLRLARKVLLDLNELGVPCGVEFLDLITPQYLAELVSWGAIGARTTESQGHRELSSGLSCPVGFKNGTRGTVKIAVDAVSAASRPHSFLSVTKAGHTAIFKTAGNEDTHIILRGGTQGPNYDAKSVAEACKLLEEAGLRGHVMVDLSHANSSKQYAKQLEVGQDVAGQIAGGSRQIFGVMIESHLVEGRQDVIPEKPLTYGQSITDACIGWEATVPLLDTLAGAVAKRRALAPVTPVAAEPNEQ